MLSLLFFSCSQAFVPRFSNKLSVVTTTSIHKRGNVSNGLHTHLSFQKYTPSIAHNGRALNRSRRYSTQIVTENLESMATKSLEFLIELFNIKALIRNVTQHFRTYTLLVVGVIATWRANLLLKWKAALSPTIEISKSTITDDSSRKIKQKPFVYSHPIRRSIDVWIFAAMFLYNYVSMLLVFLVKWFSSLFVSNDKILESKQENRKERSCGVQAPLGELGESINGENSRSRTNIYQIGPIVIYKS